MQELKVGLGDRAYSIRIAEGLLARVGKELKKLGLAKRYGIIADQYVAGLYGGLLMDSLSEAGISAEMITFPRGESSKHLATVAGLASSLARHGFDRKDALIGLGGGVSGDIAGFLAAIYMRGIPFVQVPTTLLAQVDSSVGGKTGVDIPEGKNLVGAFYQPRAVFVDSRALLSLPDEELLNGLAEVIKYGVIYDSVFFDFLESRREDILGRKLAVLEEVIEKCCAIKARVVEADEREADLRRILNYGHTIGHAVEAASNFTLAHGSAVAMGMVAAANIARNKGLLAESESARIRALIESYGLPVAIPAGYDHTEIIGYLKTDKKTVGGVPVFVLPTSIGTVVITDQVTEEQVRAVLN